MNGLLRIDGDFSGSVKTRGKVFIGRNGRADCSLNASSVVIGGVLRGSIIASEKVIILSSAVVIGSIQSPRLVAEEGVILDGIVRVTGIPERKKPEKPEDVNGKRGFFGIRRFSKSSAEPSEERKILVSRLRAWSV
jgi:cytoskeletal protein CcmA (bactofilin family)